jgi:FKBP12-rapamycin complex-associated protein
MCAAQVLDGSSDEVLRREALETICAVAVSLGADFAIFVPTVRKVRRLGHTCHALQQPS